MQSANNFIVLNIREYLENEDKRLGEETLVQLLSEFSCPLNPDVERFLKEQSIDFAKNIWQLQIWHYHWRTQSCWGIFLLPSNRLW